MFHLVSHEGQSSLTVFIPGGGVKVADSSHPNFNKIRELAEAGRESETVALFDVAAQADKKFRRLSRRVTAANGRVYLDGEEVHNVLADHVVRFLEEGVENWQGLVNFFEKIQANPDDHSREQLYRWLQAERFTITDEGLIVGYKAVKTDGEGYRSIHQGPDVLVNGEAQPGNVPVFQSDGDVVEMPRSAVTFDPGVGCARGLHVGTSNYARTFGGNIVLEVHVDPADVVSVPIEANDNKMRVCRYTVVGVSEKKYDSAYAGGSAPLDVSGDDDNLCSCGDPDCYRSGPLVDDDDDGYEYCPDCGSRDVDTEDGYCNRCDDYTL